MGYLKKIFSNITKHLKKKISKEKAIINPCDQQKLYGKCECTSYKDKDIERTCGDILCIGKWSAKDMKFAYLWNNDYAHEKRNYSRRMMAYITPSYKSFGDENNGWDNGIDEEIYLTVNVEEGKVFLEDYTQAAKIFINKNEIEIFVNEAQKKFDNELDMGKGTNFIFATLMEHKNPNIQYIPITFPDNEKFHIPNYREEVEGILIEKGAVMIRPKERKPYLAVIQRKNKPRDLKPFLRYIV